MFVRKVADVVSKKEERNAYRIAAKLGVEPLMLHKPFIARKYSWVKKIVCYYLAVEAEFSAQAVATWLGCDRSSVSYNLGRVEDLRDNYDLDVALDCLFLMVVDRSHSTTNKEKERIISYVREFKPRRTVK